MRGQALLALGALTAALAIAQPAAAEDRYYGDHRSERQSCEQQRNGRTAAGAVIGAIIGGVIGNNVAATGNQSEGTILGGVLGGAAGAAIARNSNRCDRYAEGDYAPYEDDYGPYDDGSGLYGGPNGEYDRGDCRWRDAPYWDQRGRRREERVWMCRDEYGEWRRAD
ncbi:MAG: glycine zipper 2TM domain-containing protein [Hyphomonadaceae bacterium]